MSTIIKPGAQVMRQRKLCAIDLADHLVEARQAVERAQAEAARILADARVEAAAIHEAARQDGWNAGHGQGLTQGRQEGQAQGQDEAMRRFSVEQAQLVEALSAAIREIDARKRDLLIEAGHDVLELALAFARKLTLATGRLNREAAVENLRQALRLVAGKTDVQIRFHPLDEESLRRFAADFVAERNACAHVTFAPDPSLAPGGCVVATGGAFGRAEVDASLATQMDSLVEVLLGPAAVGATEPVGTP